MKFSGVLLMLFVVGVQASEGALEAESAKHVQPQVEASAVIPLKPICLDSESSEYHPRLCEYFCSSGTRYNVENNTQIKYLYRRSLTYQGIEDFYLDLFSGSRKSPAPTPNELTLLLDKKNSQVNTLLQAHVQSLIALKSETPKFPDLIKAKKAQIDKLDTLAKTPHYDKAGNLVRSGLDTDEMKEYKKLGSERSALVKAQRKNKWAIERAQAHIAVIRDQQSIVGVDSTNWRAHPEIKNAFILGSPHGQMIFEFSADTSNSEPEKIWLQTSAQDKKLLCDASDQYVMSEKQYRASPPQLGIEHFKDWKNSLQKDLDKEKEKPESINDVVALQNAVLSKTAALKGAEEVCAWIAVRQPQSALDLRQLQLEYFKSVYNSLSSQKSTLKQNLETPRDLELEALQKVVNESVMERINKAQEEQLAAQLAADLKKSEQAERKSKRPYSPSLKPTVKSTTKKTKKPTGAESYQPYTPSYEDDSGPQGGGYYNQQYNSSNAQQQTPVEGHMPYNANYGAVNSGINAGMGGGMYGGMGPGMGGGYGGGYGGGFYGGAGMNLDSRTPADVAGILGKASEIFDYCVRQSFLDPNNKMAVDWSYDLGRNSFIYQAASHFAFPDMQQDATHLFFSLQPHYTLDSMPPAGQFQNQNFYQQGVMKGNGGNFNLNPAW